MKALAAMLTSPSFSVTVRNSVQSRNALAPIVFTVPGIVIERSDVFLWNALAPMAVTAFPSSVAGTTRFFSEPV